MQQALSLPDVERIVGLVAQAGDPTTNNEMVERKRALLEGVAQLIEADMWIWSMGMLSPVVDHDLVSTGVIDGGWQSDQQRATALRVLIDPEFNDPLLAPVRLVCERRAFTTFLRNELIPDAAWEHSGAEWRANGYNAGIVSVYPLDDDLYSAVGFHRRAKRPEFTARERAIVHVVFGQVDWLHRQGANRQAANVALGLSPRQRQVLLYLLGGESRKGIAEKLQLSEHTVGDYLKQIYKRFGVNSRPQLLAHFISGGQQ